MSDELVERLLDWPYQGETMAHDAAARIEALTAERDGLLRCVTDNHVALCRAEKAEAERDRLREALQQFLIEYDEVDLANAEPSSLTAAVLSARAALKGESHE